MWVTCIFPAFVSAQVFDDSVQLQLRPVLAQLEEDEEGTTATATTTTSTTTTTMAQAPAYVPQPDFSGFAEMQRVAVTEFPEEFYASIPKDVNDITFFTEAVPSDIGDSECAACVAAPFGPERSCSCLEMVSIPLNHHFKDVVGAKKVNGREEVGELRWIGDSNPTGSVIPGTIVGFAERFHVYEQSGPSPPPAAVPPVLPAAIEEFAKQIAPTRAGGIMKFMSASNVNGVYVRGAQDPLHLLSLSQFLEQNPKVNTTDAAQIAIDGFIAAAVASMSNLAEGAEPVSISTNCLHFIQQLTHDGHLLVKVLNGRATFPLNVNLLTVRGQTVFSPAYQLSIAVGHGFWRRKGDSLIFHTGASSVGTFDIERSGYGSPQASSTFKEAPQLKLCMACLGANLMVTLPMTTITMPAAALVATQDKRVERIPALAAFSLAKDNATYMSAMRGEFLQYAAAPMSHTYLYQSHKQLCPRAPAGQPSYFATMEHMAASLDFMGQLNDESKGFTEAEGTTFVYHMLALLPCGSDFLRAPMDHSNGLDLLEVITFSHFVMEWPASRRLHAIWGDDEQDENGVLTNGWHHKEMR